MAGEPVKTETITQSLENFAKEVMKGVKQEVANVEESH
jgi:hypothetical protein